MTILVVTNMFPTTDNPSFGCFVKSQVDSLEKKGVTIDLIFANGRASKLNYLRGAWQVFWRSLHRRYDVVHAHYGLSGLMARCQMRSPVVISFCGSDVIDNFQGRISRMISRIVNLTIVKSEQLGQALGGNKIRVIPSGLDLSLFQPMDQLQAKKTLGLSRNNRYILFAGDPENRVKRFDVARQTYRIVKKHLGFPVKLLALFGHPQDEVPLYMNACDVLLLTSDWEGSPNVVKEAMACNMPIISTDVGDVREITKGTRNCFICQQVPSVLAEKASAILNKRQRTDGRERVLHLSLEITAEKIISVYKELLCQGGPASNEEVI